MGACDVKVAQSRLKSGQSISLDDVGACLHPKWSILRALQAPSGKASRKGNTWHNCLVLAGLQYLVPEESLDLNDCLMNTLI